MTDFLSRTRILLGDSAVNRLAEAKVAIFGIGGVGGHVCEALIRSGITRFELIDSDTVSLSNLNRQLIATTKTIGRAKVDVMKERMLEINPQADITVRNCFFLPEIADTFDFSSYDYIVDAIDTITAKIELIVRASDAGVPIISAMGAGNKLDATQFRVTDIYKTNVCPLARVMRRELKKRNIQKLKVVYSEEVPVQPQTDVSAAEAADRTAPAKRSIPGSVAFVPSVAGLILAGEVIKDLAAADTL